MRLPLHITALCLAAAMPVAAQPEGIREACRQFVQRDMPDPRGADYGEYWTWTVVDNRDGSYSVGAKYRAAGPGGTLRNKYTTCIIRVRGRNFELEKLAHLIR
jgi:hypothetical protein